MSGDDIWAHRETVAQQQERRRIITDLRAAGLPEPEVTWDAYSHADLVIVERRSEAALAEHRRQKGISDAATHYGVAERELTQLGKMAEAMHGAMFPGSDRLRSQGAETQEFWLGVARAGLQSLLETSRNPWFRSDIRDILNEPGTNDPA